MKKFYFSVIILSALFFMSWSAGFTNPASGAPGDNRSCGSVGCHDDGVFDPSAEITLTDLDGNELTSFFPDTEYLVNVTISTGSAVPPTGYGFQMVCLDDQENPVNNFSDLPDGVTQFSSGSRQYVVQSRRLPVNVISIPWTAPDVGEVTFYSGANAVNGNGNPNGDGATSTTATFSQGSTSTDDLSELNVTLYPNPVSDRLNIESSINGTYQLVNERGQLLIEQETTNSSLDVSALNSGIYFLIARDGNSSPRVNRVIKRVIKI